MTTLRASIALLLVLTACGGSSEPTTTEPPTEPAATPPTKTPPATPPATPPPGDAATACNTLALDPRSVTLHNVAAAAPSPAGGTVHDGTYVLSDAAMYLGAGSPDAGPTSTTVRMTIRVTGNLVERATDQGATTGTVVAAGTTMTSTDTCPDDAKQEVGFTADETSISAFISTTGPGGAPATLVETFTKP